MGGYVTNTTIGDTEITGSGTANTWAMFTGAQSIGNSIASQNAAATIGTIAGSLVVTQPVFTTGSPTALTVTGGAHTTLTASTESILTNFNLSADVQFATGNISSQRAFVIQAPRYGFVGASTITNAATLAISGPPRTGTNATITNTDSIWVQSGSIRMEDSIRWTTDSAVVTTDYSIFRVSSAGSSHVAFNTVTGTSYIFYINGVSRYVMNPQTTTNTQVVATSGSPSFAVWTGAAHTTLTASTEAVDINYNLNRIVQFATGAIATQRGFVIQAPAYSFVAASTITNAATMAITAAPTAAVNATFTNSWALWVQAGRTRFDDAIQWVTATAIAAAAYSIQIDSGDINNPLTHNVPTGVAHVFAINSTSRLSILASTTTDAQLAATTGNPTYWLYTGGAHTGLTASAEIIDINYNLARIVQRATGAVTTQRAFLIQAPTYSFVGASTITTAATFAISAAPTAGTNATITSSYALWVQAGTSKLDGTLSVLGTANLITSTATATGALTLLTLTAAAHTNQTASTEISSTNFNLSATRQWATGAITTQREFLVQAPTYAFVGASTITTSATLSISGPPIAGTNATLTNTHALWVESGGVLVGGNAQVASALMTVQRSANSSTVFRVSNATSGTAAAASAGVSNAAGSVMSISSFSAAYTSSGPLELSTGVLFSNHTAGMNIAVSTNAQLSFWTNNLKRMEVSSGGNFGFGTTSYGASSVNVMAMASGTAPSGSVADVGLLYVADQAAGNACFHTRTEGGAIIKLFQGAAIADASGGAIIDAEARTAINALLARMRVTGGNGLIAD